MDRIIWSNYPEDFRPDIYGKDYKETFGREPVGRAFKEYAEYRNNDCLWDIIDGIYAELGNYFDLNTCKFVRFSSNLLSGAKYGEWHPFQSFFDMMFLDEGCETGKIFLDGEHLLAKMIPCNPQQNEMNFTYRCVKIEDFDMLQTAISHADTCKILKYSIPLGNIIREICDKSCDSKLKYCK